MNGYVEFDRHSDALSSLDEFCSCLERVNSNEAAWKFAIISIHCALQGYLCITLSNGDGFQTWKEHQFKKWLAAYHNKLDLPDPQLDYFMELFDKVFSLGTSISRANIEWLNETRNGLVHFNTDGYSIDRVSIIECCQEALTAIKMTPSLTKGIYFYNQEQSDQYYQSCNKASDLLDAITRLT